MLSNLLSSLNVLLVTGLSPVILHSTNQHFTSKTIFILKEDSYWHNITSFF